MGSSTLGGTIGTATMKAAIVQAPGTIRMTDVPIPEPGSGRVRVRLEGTGVCASNLAVWGGQPWFDYPFPPGALGHEGWGVVDAVGPDVTDIGVGQRVAALSSHAYAEYDVADAAHVVRLPPSLEDRAFPGEPLGCAMNIFRRSRIEPGSTVAIVGIGFLGALLTRLSANAGARVIAISRRPFSLEIARQYGASETIEMRSPEDVVDRVKAVNDGELCDRVIEAVGKQRPLDLAAQLTRERGTLVVAGYHQDGPRQVDMQLWNWRGLDVVNAHERDPLVYVQGIREAIEAVEQGHLDPDPLYSDTFPLDQLGAALDAARDRPEGFLKALVQP